MIFPSPIHALNWLSSTVDSSQVLAIFSKLFTSDDAFRPDEFDVDAKSGFFPPAPLPKLPDEFAEWEAAFAAAPGILALGEDKSEEALSKRSDGAWWRSNARSWPVKDIDILCGDIRLLQRAHMVLASLLHFYVHSLPPTDSAIIVPKSIAIPLVKVSRELSMAPVLTFADTVLWNWELIDPSLPVRVDNMRYLNIFSGTETERAFYLASAAVELKGVEMLDIFNRFQNLPASSYTDAHVMAQLAKDLGQLASIVNELTQIFQSMRETVDPTDFYWAVRPWWAGATSKGPNHPGWIFEGVPNGDSAHLDLGGASAGQSSVMHALDVFLDIDHRLATKRKPAPSEPNRRADLGFMQRMWRYMPGKHREYLTRLRSVRPVVERAPSLRDSYNAAVRALKTLRDFHIRIVAIYVVTKAGSTPPARFALDEHEGTEGTQKNGPARGTGGSEVSNLLKAGRDATQRALLQE
ncbi:Indoleamine 2,3-dioxygenase [Daedalea quercina L-15889]|uniref:Indoleamine 2,3-dioxygenase n=1 Tax=Daedalea quercina L-15889 TaxID=1314783 RepID=A0A165QQV6_9APHY|nr:Indoleamine 2,3-dioxygenase [Daedalea quercina L-15889]